MGIFELNPVGTTSALGREIRLRRIMGTDGRLMTVALDQAVPRGVAPRLADLKTVFDKIADAEPDAFTVFKGVAGHLLSGRSKQVPLIIKGSTFCVDFHLTYDATVAQVADCLRLGADAIAVGISAGSENQVAMLEMLSAVTEEAHIGPMVEIKEFVVNIISQDVAHYVKASMSLELDRETTLDEANKRMPQIRDAILLLIGNKTYEELQDIQGKNQIKAEVKSRINSFLKTGKVNNVYLTDLVVQ